jgi:hypothetical protein
MRVRVGSQRERLKTDSVRLSALSISGHKLLTELSPWSEPLWLGTVGQN